MLKVHRVDAILDEGADAVLVLVVWVARVVRVVSRVHAGEIGALRASADHQKKSNRLVNISN